MYTNEELKHELNTISQIVDNEDQIVKNVKNNLEKKTKFRKILILIVISYSAYTSGACYSLIAPFYPRVAEERGLTPSQYGFVFAVYEIVAFIVAPFFGKIAIQMTPKLFMLTALLITSGGTILFGALKWIESNHSFYCMSILIRIVWAAGGAALTTSCYLLGTLIFPNNISQVYATIETSFGIGIMIGSFFGGWLYEYGGFNFPFFVCGSFTLIAVPFICYLIEDDVGVTKDKESKRKVTLKKVLQMPSLIINLLISTVSCIAFSFNEATLDHHLREIGDFNATESGSMFLLMGLLYSVSTQVWGYIAKRKKGSFNLIIYGHIICIIGFIFFGPVFGLPMKPKLWNVILSQVLIGIGLGNILVLSFDDVVDATKKKFGDNGNSMALIAGLYSSSYSLGCSIGPIVGGYMTERFGFRIATIPIILLKILMTLIILIFIMMHNRS